MDSLQLVIQSLIKHINQLRQEGAPSKYQLIYPLDINDDFSVMDWLDAQNLYPKFYWKTRDAHEEVVALGQIASFTKPLDAYPFLQGSQRVWGGKLFSDDSSQAADFFLPSLEIVRTGEKWQLVANLANDLDVSLQHLKALCFKYEPLPSLKKQNVSIDYSPDYPAWSGLIEKALNAMDKQQFLKVVLARKTQVKLEKSIFSTQILKASQDKNHRSFHFLFEKQKGIAFVGSTPERLYRRVNQRVQTEALAGTIGRSSNLEKDDALAQWLLSDEKNLRENQFVVDDIIERLESISCEVKVQSEASLVRLRQVQHLRRTIESQLKPEIKGAELLDVLQPTAAIAGLPRQAALSFIQKNEPFKRGWYSGSVGYFGHQQAEFCVAIRSALVQDKSITLYAGAGIVPGSDAALEWEEINKKTATLLSLITNIE